MMYFKKYTDSTWYPGTVPGTRTGMFNVAGTVVGCGTPSLIAKKIVAYVKARKVLKPYPRPRRFDRNLVGPAFHRNLVVSRAARNGCDSCRNRSCRPAAWRIRPD